MASEERSELAYLLRREADERAQAEHAAAVAKPLHARLADAYCELIAARFGERRFERAKQRGL